MKKIFFYSLCLAILSCTKVLPVKVQEIKEIICEYCNYGANHYGLELEYSWQMMAKIYIEIERYRKEHGIIPKTERKNDFRFLLNEMKRTKPDSIPVFFSDWAYTDTPEKNNEITKESNPKSLELAISRCSFILYNRLDDQKYVLYWVGCNEKDDNGDGDDIVYAK